jgi:uncharacterized coiled-coil protein SlyX
MCLNAVRISILKARIKSLEGDVVFEESQVEIVGESTSIDKTKANLNRLNERLVELQSKIDVPSSLS